jgi:hypothetical protein
LPHYRLYAFDKISYFSVVQNFLKMKETFVRSHAPSVLISFINHFLLMTILKEHTIRPCRLQLMTVFIRVDKKLF